MTPEQVRATASLATEYIQLRAEFIAFRSLLTIYRTENMAVPATWERDLQGARSLPAYRDFLNSFEPEISLVRRNASENQLNALLHKIEQKILLR